MEYKNEHPIVYPTVDCAIFKDCTFEEIYLARKPGQTLYRFVGGFVDPTDNSYMDAAIRETKEETGLKCTVMGFVTSRKIDDERYRDKEDKIITSLFALDAHGCSNAVAMDDIEEVRAFRLNSIKSDDLVPEHRELFRALKDWVDKRNATERRITRDYLMQLDAESAENQKMAVWEFGALGILVALGVSFLMAIGTIIKHAGVL